MTYYIKPTHVPRVDGVYAFEKTICLENAVELELCIFAASRYILYVNGEYVCEGPCRSHEKVRYFDRVRHVFSKGQNKIYVKVLHTCTYFTSVYNTPTPQLAIEGRSGNAVILSTEKSWTCRFLGAYRLLCHAMYSLPPYEAYDAREPSIPLPLEEAEKAIFQSDGFFTRGGAAYPYIMEERPIPMIYPQESKPLGLIRKGEGFAEFDAGAYTTAKVLFTLSKESAVKVIYAECYEFEDGKHRRDDSSGQLRGYFDTVTSADSSLDFETYWFRSFRYIRIEGDVDSVSSVQMQRVHYPFEISGSFECSDPDYNRIWDVSINTLLCCSHEIISDCPYYEQQQYQFDSAVQIQALSAITSDVRLTKKCIDEFARSQQPCGLLLSIYPASWAQQIIPSFSLIWIMMLGNYYRKTKDSAFVSLYTGIVDGVLGFFDRMIKEKGFLTNTRYWNFFDWVPQWENGGPPVGENEVHALYHFYYAIALDDASMLAKSLCRDGLAAEYLERKRQAIEIVRRACYRKERGMYSDSSSGNSFSAHTSILAILAGAYEENEQDSLIDSFFYKDISRPCFSMNYFLFRALEKCGCYERGFSILDAWKEMLANGCTSWCENPDSPRSECHGWSSTPLYEFTRHVLGVNADEKDEIRIQPFTDELSYARGSVSTRFGEVFVSWKKENGGFRISIRSQGGVKKRLCLFGNKEYLFENEEADFFEKDVVSSV